MLRKDLAKGLLAVAVGVLAVQAPSHAAVTYATGTNAVSIPGLTGFMTTGANMDGLSVTATFSNGFSQTASWVDTGATSGAAFGANWSLQLDGDTFNAPWNFAESRVDTLTRLVLDGLAAFTVFDRTSPSPGTNGSANGLDFDCTSASAAVCSQNDILVTYDYAVGIGGAAPVGDLWQTVTIEFRSGPGPGANWSFVQDTDNDISITQVPEPASLLLLGLGVGALAFAGRRRKQV